MVFRNIHISLDNMPVKGYLPGSTVMGKVITIAEKRIRINSLTIQVKGEAAVRFTDTVRRRRTTVRTAGSTTSVSEDTTTEFETFTGHEGYISTTYRLQGETYIEPGEREFNFSVILPSNIPSTFYSQHGSIKYWIAVTMDKSWNFDQVVKIEFEVCAPKDLSRAQGLAVRGNITSAFDLATEQVYKKSKHFNFFCCRSGPLCMVVSIPKSGLVPGEIVHITIDVNNDTEVKISSVKILVMQEVICYSHFPQQRYKTENKTLQTVHCQAVASGGELSWRQPVQMPSIGSVNIDECSIIQQQHYILVQAVPEGMHLRLEVTAPIVFGTLPVGRVAESFVNPFQPQPPVIGIVPHVQRLDVRVPPPPLDIAVPPRPLDMGVLPQPLDIGVPPPPYKGQNLPSPEIGFIPPDIGFVKQSSPGVSLKNPSIDLGNKEPSAPVNFHPPASPPPYPVESVPYPLPEKSFK